MGFAGGTGTHDGPAAGRRESGEPTANEGAAPDGRRCPRPARPVTAFGGLAPPVAGSPGFTRSPTGSCRRRRTDRLRRPSARTAAWSAGLGRRSAGISPALPTQTGVSRTFTGVPSCSRTPLARGPVLGLPLPPPRRRRSGPVRFSFGTWAFAPSRVHRRRPPSHSVSALADPERDVRVCPRPQWGSRMYRGKCNKICCYCTYLDNKSPPPPATANASAPPIAPNASG